MITIKDIAKLAGVSHGTVSNVLNGRGNVSLEKIMLVENAAKQLGYSINERGQQLRNPVQLQVGVVLPNIRDERYSIVYSTLSSYLRDHGGSCTLYLTDDIPNSEEDALNEIAGRRLPCVVLVSCQPEGSEARTLLKKNGTRIICIERKTADVDAYIGFNNEEIASEIIRRVSCYKAGRISVITGLLIHSNEKTILEGVERRLSGIAQVRVYQTDTANAMIAAFKCACDPLPSDLIVTTSPFFAKQLLDAYGFGQSREYPKMITLAPSKLIDSQHIFDNIFLDWHKLAIHAAKMALGETAACSVEMPIAHRSHTLECKTQIPKRTSLNVLMLEGTDTQALRKLLPDFTRATGIEVQFASFPYQEINGIIRDAGRSGVYDVIRMDVVWLSTFYKDNLEGYDPDDPLIKPIFDSILDEVKEPYSMVNGKVYAFPFTPNIQLQFYRKDIFEDTKVKRAFYESCRQELTVPGTFEEYAAALRFFCQNENPTSPVAYGAAIASGTISTMAGEYLPIFFGMGGTLFDAAGRPQLYSEAGKNALACYLENSRYMLSVSNAWWSALVDNFSSGRTAMMNLFTNHVFNINDLRKSKIAGQIGYASVPGGKPLMGGGVLGVASSSKKKEAALEFIRWACSERISLPFTLLGGISPCKKVYANTELLELFPWLSIVPSNYKNAVMRRVPVGMDEYAVERCIGLAVKSALSGVVSPEDALRNAQLQLEKMIVK